MTQPLTKCQGIDCPNQLSCWRFLAPDMHPPSRQAYGNFDDVRTKRRCAYKIDPPERSKRIPWRLFGSDVAKTCLAGVARQLPNEIKGADRLATLYTGLAGAVSLNAGRCGVAL